MWNYLSWAEQYSKQVREFRDGMYLRHPRDVSIETRVLCNAACTFCPYPTLERKGTVMSDALLEKILSECRDIPASVPFDITPCRVNEPFLDSRMFDIASWIAEDLPHVGINFFTNASPLNEKTLLRLSGYRNVARMIISLHENRPEAYERVMGIPFQRTIRNVEQLHEMKAQGLIAFPVEISRVGDGTPQDEAFCEWGRATFPLFTTYYTARTDWIGAVNTVVSPVLPIPCGQWFKLNFLADGRAAYCCQDSDGGASYGDANRQHI